MLLLLREDAYSSASEPEPTASPPQPSCFGQGKPLSHCFPTGVNAPSPGRFSPKKENPEWERGRLAGTKAAASCGHGALPPSPVSGGICGAKPRA